MTAAAGITTTGGSPNAVVAVQAGMNVQPVVLVDQNGQYITAPSSVLTTKGDLLYENATPAPARLAIGTANQLLYVSSGLPAWGEPSNFAPTGLTGATAASRYAGATASGAPSSGTFAVGDFVIDQGGNFWVCTTAGTPGTWASPLTQAINAANDLYRQPAGATGATMSRWLPNVNSNGILSGQLSCMAIVLPAGVAVNNITIWTGATAASGVTHGWYVLLDQNLVVRAVSADQTGGNWGSAKAAVTLSVSGSAYTTTYAGLYYIGIMVAASQTPNLTAFGSPNAPNLIGVAPVVSGTSSTGQTTPPSTGTTMSALTQLSNCNFYAYTS